MRIYLDDLKRIIELLELNGRKTEFETGEYEFDSLTSLLQKESDIIYTLTIISRIPDTYSSTLYLYFNPRYAYITSHSSIPDDDLAWTVAAHVHQFLEKKKLFDLIMLRHGAAFIISMAFLLILMSVFGGGWIVFVVSIAFTLFANWWIPQLFPLHSTIILSPRNASRGFWAEHRDKIFVAFLTALVVAPVTLFSSFINRKLATPTTMPSTTISR